MKIKRKVDRVKNYVVRSTPHGGSTNAIYLECGHEVYRKNSQGIPGFVYCKECERPMTGLIGKETYE